IRFEPHGFTKNPDIPIAKSIVDYIFRWLGVKFLGYAPASVAHETARDDPLEASGVHAVAESQLTLIQGGTNGHGQEAMEDDRSLSPDPADAAAVPPPAPAPARGAESSGASPAVTRASPLRKRPRAARDAKGPRAPGATPFPRKHDAACAPQHAPAHAAPAPSPAARSNPSAWSRRHPASRAAAAAPRHNASRATASAGPRAPSPSSPRNP